MGKGSRVYIVLVFFFLGCDFGSVEEFYVCRLFVNVSKLLVGIFIFLYICVKKRRKYFVVMNVCLNLVCFIYKLVKVGLVILEMF